MAQPPALASALQMAGPQAQHLLPLRTLAAPVAQAGRRAATALVLRQRPMRPWLQVQRSQSTVPAASATSSSSSTAEVRKWRDVGAHAFGDPAVLEAMRKAKLGGVSPGNVGRFYQRVLPVTQVPFSSEEGRRLFREALAAGMMENYFFLAEQFRTQDEPTFCGLSTLAMVLNSLRIDPMRTWQGAWRWFNETNLGCCTGPDQVREFGMSFDMFKCLAICNGADVSAHRAPSPEQEVADPEAYEMFLRAFRSTVRATCRSEERECMVVCYSRQALDQSGSGHFSPIGGYHEATDSVLILDVARFKYPPHWARLTDVAEGMRMVDDDTGKPRGWMMMRLQTRSRSDRGAPHPMPLHIPYVPAAAGRRLSEALTAALSAPSPICTGGCGEPAMMTTMSRWLRAVSTVEPQVLAQLLDVGDATALKEVLTRLQSFSTFSDLCDAYAVAVAVQNDGIATNFPPLSVITASVDVPDPGMWKLGTCGELWVLLLLLLPEHLRAAVSKDLSGNWVARGVAKAVRGPWALPLEALREALGHSLPPPQTARKCGGPEGPPPV